MGGVNVDKLIFLAKKYDGWVKRWTGFHAGTVIAALVEKFC